MFIVTIWRINTSILNEFICIYYIFCFTLLYVGGTYARFVYIWYQNIFHVIAVLIVFHAANKKNRMKAILNQDSNSRQRQDIVPVRNLKARKIKTFCHYLSTWLIIDLLPLLSLHCRSAVAPLSLLLSLHCRSCYCPCFKS